MTLAQAKKTFSDPEIMKIMMMKEMARNTFLSERNIGNVISYANLGNVPPIGSIVVAAGGFFYSTFHNETPRDFDVFILAQVEAISPKIKTPGLTLVGGNFDYSRNNPFIIEAFSIKDDPYKVNYVVTRYQRREEMIGEFDYVHCCVSYSSYDNMLYISRQTYNAIRDKTLVVNNSYRLEDYRKQKFLDRGFKVPSP
jgi:hypothetical protein